ncbi:MAG: o-succinylbenzoate--CoA ligase [Candidatus Kariarchaeaceae archaeon]|jgi:O-succinylbenzoic acid--CoA ligase
MQDWLYSQVKTNPDKIALVIENLNLTYKELDSLVTNISLKLRTWGVKPTNKVVVLMENRLDYVILIHAILRLKAILVPLNIRLNPEEIKWQLNHISADYLICSSKTENKVVSNSNQHIISVDKSNTFNSLGNLTPSQDYISHDNMQDLDSSCCIMFTSGTTGKPKGTILTYSNLFYSAIASSFQLGILPDDRWLLVMPLYHIGGLSIVIRSCIYGTGIVLHSKFSENEIALSIEKNKVTLISLVPIMVRRLLNYSTTCLSQSMLRLILVGGDTFPPLLLERCESLKLPIAATYGLTEASSQVATALPEFVYHNPTSVGRSLLFTSLRILDPEGNEVAQGVIGEIAIKGPTIMKGYYNDNSFSSGQEFRTGDLGFLDEEGNLHVKQRRIDLIISGGENIYPSEVENVLNAHPDILESCVVGLNNIEWGSIPAALIARIEDSHLNQEQVITHCKKYLATYKIPKLIKFVTDFPRTPSGKIIRRHVQNQLNEME